MTHSRISKLHCQTLQSDSIQDSGSGSPPWCITPASAGSESAHNSSTQESSRFIDSPSIEVVDKDGRTSAATFHSISRIDDDIVRFRTFVENKDFDRLTDLCHEKYMLARDSQESLRWRKDYAIVKALQGKYGEALKVLMDAHFLASQVTGSTRGKYEDECGIVLVEFGRPLLAIDRFDLALEHHRGDALACGQVWNNKAVALDVLGEPSKALRCVASSIELLTPTGDIVSLEETRRTGMRILGR
jgi:hypothetical protein